MAVESGKNTMDISTFTKKYKTEIDNAGCFVKSRLVSKDKDDTLTWAKIIKHGLTGNKAFFWNNRTRNLLQETNLLNKDGTIGNEAPKDFRLAMRRP